MVAAGMTLLNALVGVGAGMAGLFAVSSVVELTSTAPILALMLGLAVGIDYSLFITSRHRQYLTEGMDAEEAAGRAVGTAGSAVVFAGATVVIALAGLTVVNIPFLSVMGLAAAGTVAVAVLVALTLLPALLGFAATAYCPASSAPGTRRPTPPTSPMSTARASASAGAVPSPASASRSSSSASSASAYSPSPPPTCASRSPTRVRRQPVPPPVRRTT